MERGVNIKQLDAESISVSFSAPFDDEMLAAIRSINGRKWDNTHKVWVIPKKAVSELETKLKLAHNKTRTDNTVDLKSTADDLKKVHDILTAKHYSPKTIKRYLKWIENFLLLNKNAPTLGEEHLNQFLTNLATRQHVSASTQNQALAALLFYFRFITINII